MNRLASFAGSAVVLTLALAGCGVTPPGTNPTATASSTAPTPSFTPTPSASTSSASPSPSASKLILGGTGIGAQAFGTPQLQVVKVLDAQLGAASEKSQGQSCDLDPTSSWQERYVYKDLWVEFSAKDTKKTSPRTLTAWGFALGKSLPSSVALADQVPLNLSFAQLKAKYPQAKTIKTGVPGTTALQLPNKIMFVGGDSPEVVQAGTLGTCE